MKLNKLILVPLLAAIADFVKNLTGYELSNDNIDLAANVILGLVTIGGVWMNRHKKTKEPAAPAANNEAYFH